MPASSTSPAATSPRKKKPPNVCARASSNSACWSAGVTDYALIMLDPDGNVTSWNAGAERIKGYTERGDHRPAFLAVLHRRTTAPAACPSARSRSRPATGKFEAEAWRVRKDGSRFCANVVIDAIRDEHRRV